MAIDDRSKNLANHPMDGPTGAGVTGIKNMAISVGNPSCNSLYGLEEFQYKMTIYSGFSH
jgi:hypothetical protein